jgi:hypothetical protein
MDPERAGLQTVRIRLQRDLWGVNSVTVRGDSLGVRFEDTEQKAEELTAKVAAFSSSIVLP